MKKIIFSIIAVAFLASCDSSGYTINGIVQDVAEGEMVYLYKDRDKGMIIDSVAVTGGKFTFSGEADVAEAAYLGLPDTKGTITFILEKGTIQIHPKVGITGTPLNDKLNAFSQKIESLDESSLKPNMLSFIKENMDNPLGMIAVGNSYYFFDLEGLKEIQAIIPAKNKEDKITKKIDDIIIKLSATAVGTKFTDIKGLTPEGKEMALSDYAGKGKLVLVDFWASWCPPCVRDMPLLVEAYAKYKDKGFEIVGVSLDDNNDAWKHKIEVLNITWPQVSDLKGWDSELSKPYAVSSIPHTILIDAEGTIVAKNVEGKDLDAKLNELLNK